MLVRKVTIVLHRPLHVYKPSVLCVALFAKSFLICYVPESFSFRQVESYQVSTSRLTTDIYNRT